MLYRKKPVVIEAVPVSDVMQHYRTGKPEQVPAWVDVAVQTGVVVITPNDLEVMTLEGKMKAPSTFMLIRGIHGEIYPCERSIFAASYEPVSNA